MNIKPLLIFFLLFLFSISMEFSVKAIPIIPNKAIVEGTVSEYSILSSRLLNIEPEQTIYKVTVLIQSSKDVEGFQNLIKGKEGKDISFYSKKKYPEEVFGKRIKGEVIYRGDERGGLYWINSVEIMGE